MHSESQIREPLILGHKTYAQITETSSDLLRVKPISIGTCYLPLPALPFCGV